MTFTLLLADSSDPSGRARPVTLYPQVLQTSPGGEDVTVSFRPNRADDLHASAKSAAQLAYRILLREGIVRSQLVVRFKLDDAAPRNVMGRSADLLFALAVIVPIYEENGAGASLGRRFLPLAATGVLAADGSVRPVDHLPSKLAAACDSFNGIPAAIFFPADNAAEIDLAALSQRHPNLRLRAIGHLDQALEDLGIVLERVYLRNPFRGLEYFDFAHRAIFFGRDVQVRQLVEQLLRREARGTPGVLIEGASGSGKSSFVRAGLLPALVIPSSQSPQAREALRQRPVRDSVRSAIWRAGHLAAQASEGQVTQSILDCWRTLPELAATLPSACSSLAVLADARLKHWPQTQRFVWLIDQLEELFALGFLPSVVASFGDFLLRLQPHGVWTLGCIRADAVPLLKQYPSFREVFGSNEGQYYLETIRGTDLDDVIARPAQAAGLTFDVTPQGKRLDQLLRQEVYAARDNTLPLLQFTLHELYQRRAQNLLPFAAYQEIGGLSGSVANAAEAALQPTIAEFEQVVPRIFRALVTVDDEGRASKRFAPLEEVASEPHQRHLLERLVSARLCVTDRSGGTANVAFAHEALLRTWPRLADWLKRESGLLRIRDMAQREARLWLEHAKSDAWLAAADKLASFRCLDAAQIGLSADVRGFIDRSERQVRRATRSRQAAVTLIALLAVSASIGALIAFRNEGEAQYQTAQAQKAQMRLLTDVAAERLRGGDLAYARGIILEVLRHEVPLSQADPAAINVFQEVRAADPTLVTITGASFRRATFSPDGSEIVTASQDDTARIWDAQTGVELKVLSGHTSPVHVATFSPDGSQVLTASADGTARIWDARTGRELLKLADPDISTAAYSPDGSRIASVSPKRLRIWDGRTGAAVASFSTSGVGFFSAPGAYLVTGSVAFSPDGRHLVTAMDNRTARIWDARTGRIVSVLSGHTDDVVGVAYSRDGGRIVTAGDTTARIWDSATGRLLRTLSGHSGFVYSAAFSPDDRTVATASPDRTARIWNADTGEQLKVLSGHVNIVVDAAYSPDGTKLVTTGWDNTVRIWDLGNGPQALTLHGHGEQVRGVTFAPDGQHVLAVEANDTARIWDLRTGQPLTALHISGEDVGSANYSPDGRRVLTTSSQKVLHIWDARTATVQRTLTAPAPVVDASYSHDGQRLVAAFDDSTFGVWNIDSGSFVGPRAGHIDSINSVAFSPDDSRILTASIDDTARLWDAHTLVQVAVMAHHDIVSDAEFSPDGSRIVTGNDDNIARIWDSHTSHQVGTLSGHHLYVVAVAFSPDGSRIATGSSDQTVRVWDARTATELAVLAGHINKVTTVAFSPDSARVASSSTDGTIRIWDARFPDVATQVLWAWAAEPDPLADLERTQTGRGPTASLVTQTTLNSYQLRTRTPYSPAGATECDRQAGAFYDRDRHTQGLDQGYISTDAAISACTPLSTAKRPSARALYELGRALVAKSDFTAARANFERAVSMGYAAARIDLALLLTKCTSSLVPPLTGQVMPCDQRAKMLAPNEAVSLYEAAWQHGNAYSAFELGQLYEHGLDASAGTFRADPVLALRWYGKAAAAGNGNALARLAGREEHAALEEKASVERNAHLLAAFILYAQAVRAGEAEQWPNAVLRSWRYRRATLARVLAERGMMKEVAAAYEATLSE